MRPFGYTNFDMFDCPLLLKRAAGARVVIDVPASGVHVYAGSNQRREGRAMWIDITGPHTRTTTTASLNAPIVPRRAYFVRMARTLRELRKRPAVAHPSGSQSYRLSQSRSGDSWRRTSLYFPRTTSQYQSWRGGPHPPDPTYDMRMYGSGTPTKNPPRIAGKRRPL